MAQLGVSVPPLRLRNPILSASGTFGHGLEMQHLAPPERLGGLVSKTVTLRPRPGNPAPRICETEAGFLNSIGLENPGLDAYLRDVLPAMAAADTCVITNIGGESAEDFAALAAALDGEPAVDALEVNLSCPNIQGGKLPFSTDPALAARVIEGVRARTSKPILAKLSPNVARLSDIARAVEAAGASAITAVNTVLGMRVDWRTRRPGLFTTQGGYSGTGIKPIALRCVYQARQALAERGLDTPLVGIGGIATIDDVMEFLVAVATAVQIGTANYYDPTVTMKLVDSLPAAIGRLGGRTVADVVGTLKK